MSDSELPSKFASKRGSLMMLVGAPLLDVTPPPDRVGKVSFKLAHEPPPKIDGGEKESILGKPGAFELVHEEET